MKVKTINVANEILRSRFGYWIECSLADKYIEKLMKEIDEPTVLIFNFDTVSFDHYFTGRFGKIYKESNKPNSNFDVIFMLSDSQKYTFFLGLLDYLEIKYSKEKDGQDIQKFFVDKEFYIKLIDNKNEISFIGNLNDETKEILNFINTNLEADFNKLHSQESLVSSEVLVKKLDELKVHKFVHYNENGVESKYYSIYKSINQKL